MRTKLWMKMSLVTCIHSREPVHESLVLSWLSLTQTGAWVLASILALAAATITNPCASHPFTMIWLLCNSTKRNKFNWSLKINIEGGFEIICIYMWCAKITTPQCITWRTVNLKRISMGIDFTNLHCIINFTYYANSSSPRRLLDMRPHRVTDPYWYWMAEQNMKANLQPFKLL